MTAVRVDVTFDDIAHGFPGNCATCPVALAVSRLVADGISVAVGAVAIAWDSASAAGVVNLPWQAEKFIARFDDGDLVEPFGFEIDLPDEILAAVPPC